MSPLHYRAQRSLKEVQFAEARYRSTARQLHVLAPSRRTAADELVGPTEARGSAMTDLGACKNLAIEGAQSGYKPGSGNGAEGESPQPNSRV